MNKNKIRKKGETPPNPAEIVNPVNKPKQFLLWCAALSPILTAITTVLICLPWGLPDIWRAETIFSGTNQPEVLAGKMSRATTQRILLKQSVVLPDKENKKNCDQTLGEAEHLRAWRRYLFYTENPDEMTALAAYAGMQPAKWDLRPRNFQYGGGYLYAAGATIAASAILNGEPLRPNLQKSFLNPKIIGRRYLAGRAFNLLALLVLFAGAAMLLENTGIDTRHAVLGAGIICCLPGVINWCLLLKPHLWGTSLIVLSWAVALRFDLRQTPRRFLAAMALAGLAIGSHYGMVAGIIVPLITLSKINNSRFYCCRLAITGCLVSAFIFFICNPYLLFYPELVQLELNWGKPFYKSDFLNPELLLRAVWLLGVGCGPVGGVLLISGLKGFSQRKKQQQHNWMLYPCAVFFILMPAGFAANWGYNALTVRFILPGMVLVVVNLLYATNQIRNPRLRSLAWSFAGSFAITGCLWLGMVVYQGIQTDRPIRKAAAFIQKTLPEKAIIYINGDPAPYTSPPIPCNLKLGLWQNNSRLQPGAYLVSTSPIPEAGQLLASFQNSWHYHKMSFAEREFYIYSSLLPAASVK